MKKRTPQFRFRFLPVVISLFAVLTFGIGLGTPKQANAFGFVFTAETSSIPAIIEEVKDLTWRGLKSAAYVAFKNSVRILFEQVSYETAVWLASGGNNQQPLVRLRELGDSVVGAGDAAAGEFFNGLADEAGLEELNLCSLPEVQSLHLQLFLPGLTGRDAQEKQARQAKCTLTQQVQQFENRWEKARSFIDDPSSIQTLSVSLSKGGNGLSTTMAAWDGAIDAEVKAENEETVAALKSDFTAQKSKVGGYIETPSDIIEQQVRTTVDNATTPDSIVTGDVVADSLSIFVNTLASKLIDRYKSGFFDFVTTPDIVSLTGKYGGATGTSGGIAGAREKFASFQRPALQQGGDIDIVAHMANCPDQGADVTNCVIDNLMQSAIREQKTVREAVEQGPLNNETEINVRMATILRRYSIVPVGWQLAAEYHEDFDQGGSLRLSDLMEQFDDCGEGGLYSPYCGLIDPDWVLKAPDVLCKLEGYGETFVTEPQAVNTDGNEYTPDEYVFSRANTCLDPQSCLSEDGSGNCLAYGYCTKQKSIYRFEGESCPAHAASCTLFEDDEGGSVGLLTNTVNRNDCNANNAGCLWYCSETDADGNYTCSDPQEGSSIYFDSQVSTCESGDVGCTELMSVKGGTNLVMNSEFDQFNGERRPSDQTKADVAEVGSAAGGGNAAFDDEAAFYGNNGGGASCAESSAGQRCYGWEKKDGVGFRIARDADEGLHVGELNSGSGYIQTSFDTGQPLANRSFVLSFTSKNTNYVDSCSGKYWVEAADDFAGGNNERQEFIVDYPVSDDYQLTSSTVVTFADNTAGNVVRVGIEAGSTCMVGVDNVKLEENNVSSGYTQYGEQTFSMNIAQAPACNVDDIGCTTYTPQTGEGSADIVGRITNPLSDACTGPDAFANPECSQCLPEFVGCDAFIQEETPFGAPVKDSDKLTGSATDETRNAVAIRSGMYCDGTDQACNSNDDCGGNLCLPSISIVPSSGESCSAASVGCEEYTNLDSVAAGGEGLEYYKYIRQCVKPTAEQQDNNQIGTYYTFEGSDDTGYQLVSWELKRSNITSTENPEVGGAPCTNLDLYGSTAQTPEANCVDTVDTMNTCSVAEVGNGECLEFYDSAGRTYYINQSATISVSDACVGLRNSLDGRTYFSIPAESQSCSAQDNLCREYKGSQAEAARVLLDENFDDGAWGGEASGEVVTANTGFSMSLGTSSTSQRGSTPVQALSTSKSYVVTFWAKKDNAGDTSPVRPLFISGGTDLFFDGDNTELATQVSTEWRQYTAGPFAFENSLQGGEEFGFQYEGSRVYIDNVQLFENGSQYVKHGTADICHGNEGCELYTDSNNDQNFLKSFDKLCDEDAAGCQAVINTNNADLPYYEKFNTDNEFANDDVSVDVHTAQAYIVSNEYLCNSEFAGCTAYGQPTLDGSGNAKPDEYSEVYFVNDPDTYSESLCQNQQLLCKEWKADNGSTSQYFKDPGDKLCTYSSDGLWVDEEGNECALANPEDALSQPKGAVCSTDSPRAGQSCNDDADCRTSDTDPISARCISTEPDSGYVGACEPAYSGCTTYVDPNTESLISNSDFEADAVDNANASIGIPDGKPDKWLLPVLEDSTPSDNNFLQASGNNCAIFESSTDQAHDGGRSIALQTNTAAADHCFIAGDTVPIDEETTYTLSGYVFVEQPTAEFAIGLTYYDSVGNELAVPAGDVNSYAIAAYEGGGRSTIAVGAWQRFHATIGRNLVRSFPDGTYFVRPFIETGNTSERVYFDTVEFTQDEEYTYINTSVNGSPQYDGQNECSTGIDPALGCVAVRDTTNDNLSLVSDNDVAVGDPCTFNTGDDNDACRSAVNAPDSNIIVKVRNDRECSEWLSCASEVRVQGAEDSSLDCFETGNCSCIDIRKCLQRNPETGTCTRWADSVDPDDLGFDDDLTVNSNPNDTSELESIQNVSGFATAGATWTGAYCDSQTNRCIGGANHGNSCDTGCGDAISYGFYPFDWMPQVGLGGAATSSDPVKFGSFEDVYCDGVGVYDDDELVNNAVNFTNLKNALENTRDTSQKCTSDWHCRSPELDALFQRADLYEGGANVQDIHYEEGWCNNVQDGEWKTVWKTSGGNNNAQIVDYDDGTLVRDGYETLAQLDENYKAKTGADISAQSLDFNNFMFVQPQVPDLAEGIEQTISEGIAEGQEYTVSFDAAYTSQSTSKDRIEVGLRHGDEDSTDVDYFELGTGIADVVFILDASNSMAPYIQEISEDMPVLMQDLQNGGVDVQASIVGTGQNFEPFLIDFADYDTAGVFGSSNGITTAATQDVTTVQAAMNYMAATDDDGNPVNLLGGSARNYEALKDIADNNLGIPFRAGAKRYVVLLTDTTPEQDEFNLGTDEDGDGLAWDPSDEIAFIDTFDGAPYILNSIVAFTPPSGRTASANQAYDNITPEFGGSVYDIAAADYTTLLTSIKDGISKTISDFTFTNTVQHYVLGPLTIENKGAGGRESTLFIRETKDSENTPFVLDNVSLKPALELNKEGNEYSSSSTLLAGQTCRAYPQEDSAQCDYVSNSGEIFLGWKGYCVEYDPADADKQNKKCLTWWPIDAIAGDSSATNSVDQIEYNQKYPAYHCLVAKGNANLGACTDDGTICVEDGDCGNSQCLGNGTTNYTPTGKTSDDLSISVETGGYKVTNTIRSVLIDNFPDDSNEQSHEDPVDPKGSLGIGNDDFHEAASFQKLNPSRVEQLIHISEIDRLQFFIGKPEFDDQNGDKQTYEYAEPRQAWWMSGDDTVEGGRYVVNGFDSLEWESSATGELFYSQYNRDNEEANVVGVFKNEAKEDQSTYDEDDKEDENGIFAIQAGAWCGDEICDQRMSAADVEDMDFVFVKGVTGARNDETAQRLKQSGRVYNNGEPLNPFNRFDELAPDSNVWGKRTLITAATDADDEARPKAGGEIFDEVYFHSRFPEKRDEDRECFDTEIGDNVSGCGANIVGVKFDFEDGYLQNIYLFYWDAFHRFDARVMTDVQWTYFLREPCLLLAEGANELAEATPWYNNIQKESRYRVNGIPYAHTMYGTNALFGSLGGKDSVNPTYIDGLGNDGIRDFTAAGANLPFVFLNAAEGSALPFACIGDCGGTACSNGDWENDYSENSCTNEDGDSVWIGVPGVCSSVDTDSEAHFCNDDADCSDLGLGSCILSGTGQFISSGDGGQSEPDDINDICFSNPRAPVCDTTPGAEGAGVQSAQRSAQVDDNPGSGNDPEGDGTDGNEGRGNPGNSSGTDGGTTGDTGNTGNTSGSGTTTTSSTSGLSGAGSDASLGTYLQQLNAAARVGWSRYRLLFANINTIYYANQDPNHENRYGYRDVNDDGVGDSSVSPLYTTSSLLNFCDDTDRGFVCDAFNENVSDPDSKDFLDNATMNECGSSGRTSSDEYCGVRPTISNIRLNGETNSITINNGEVVDMQFDSSVDGAQIPIEYVSIVWEGTADGAIQDELAVPPKTWGGRTTDNYFFRHVYPCTLELDKRDGVQDAQCTYNVKLQIQDAWGFCSGDIDQTITRDENFGGACTSYTQFDGTVNVKL